MLGSADLGEEPEPIAAGQILVGDDQVNGPAGEELERTLGRADDVDVVPGVSENAADDPLQRRLVLYKQQGS